MSSPEGDAIDGRPRARLQLGLAAAAVALVLALGVAAGVVAHGYRAPFPGLLVYRSGAVASLWRADWAGRRVGLQVRDVVLAVDGTTLPAGVPRGPALGRALEARAGQATVALTLRRPDGQHLERRLPLGQLSRGDNAYTFALPFSIGLVYLLLGALIYGLKRTPPAALATALCLVAAAFYLTMFDAHTTYRFTRVWLCYPLLGALSVHLFAIFPERRPRLAGAGVLAPLYLVGVAVVAWRQWVIDDAARSDLGSFTSSCLLVCEFALDLGLLGYTMLRGASPAVRNRAKSIFFGLALTCTASVAWQFASRLPGPSRLLTADVAMVLSALFPALIAYAILTRNLFDFDAVLRAGLIYVVATALVLGLYFAAVFVASHLAFTLVGTTFGGALTLAMAGLFHPLRRRVQDVVDRLLYRESRLPALLALLRALPSVEDVPSLVEVALGPLLRLTHAHGVVLWVRERGRLEVAGRAGELPEAGAAALDPDGALAAALEARPRPQALRDLLEEVGEAAAGGRAFEPLGLELLVPLVRKGRLGGVLAFTAPRGGGYGYACLRALADAAPQLALALEKAELTAERAQRERLAALGAMAAVIVHEVKNPLGIIKVSAGTLRQRARDLSATTLCACIEDEVDRMDATVRRLLELARPPEPALAPCDVAALIRQTLERLGPDLAAAGILVGAELGAVPRVSADAEELRRALLNLLLNAREAMPGGGRLTVRLRAIDGGGDGDGVVEIEVEDSGVGMDEGVRRQLFRPFFTTRHGGTGLGLAIVKRVVEEHRGAIRVESQPGQGARFTLSLPT